MAKSQQRRSEGVSATPASDTDSRHPGHDIVVIGASLGGIEPLFRVFEQLAPQLPAALFVVRHTRPEAGQTLVRVLAPHSTLPVEFGQDKDHIRLGRVYVAPPDFHMLISGDQLRVVHGPRENLVRPAIDPLFRSAAVAYRSRVIGVVLSGLLDDGAAGLAAVKRCGGIAIVQRPEDAIAPEMPRNVLRTVDVDHCVPTGEIGLLINGLVPQQAAEPPPVPEDLALEVDLTESVETAIGPDYRLGNPSPYVCPECGGALWEIQDDKLLRYRCHVGHTLGPNTLLHGQRDDLEKAMWAAARIIEQHCRLLDRMAADSAGRGHELLATNYRRRKDEYDEQAKQIRKVLLTDRTPRHWRPTTEKPVTESVGPRERLP